jgi:hypothetical protein
MRCSQLKTVQTVQTVKPLRFVQTVAASFGFFVVATTLTHCETVDMLALSASIS